MQARRSGAGVTTGSVWSPLIALVFVVAAALSFAVDQVVALSADWDPPAAAAVER